MANQIRCVNKEPRFDPHLRIQNLGGLNADGTRWKLTEDEAIRGIEEGKSSFYVSAGGRTVSVEIAVHEGHKYLKTAADGYSPDNLLSLPECP